MPLLNKYAAPEPKSDPEIVMAGLGPAISLKERNAFLSGMPATSAGMTIHEDGAARSAFSIAGFSSACRLSGVIGPISL